MEKFIHLKGGLFIPVNGVFFFKKGKDGKGLKFYFRVPEGLGFEGNFDVAYSELITPEILSKFLSSATWHVLSEDWIEDNMNDSKRVTTKRGKRSDAVVF